MKNKYTSRLRGLTLIEILVGMTVSAAIFLVATNLITALFGSSTKQKQIETLEQTKNDLQQDIGNSVKWAENEISFRDGVLVTDDDQYELRDGILYKNSSPLTPSSVYVESFEVYKYSTSQVATETQKGIGLSGTYFNTQTFSDPILTRIDPLIDFNWDSDSPDTRLNADNFSVRWSGQIETSLPGDYRFRVESNDGSRLTIDDTLLIDSWQDGSTSLTEQIYLEGDRRYNISLEYYDHIGRASISLFWGHASFGQELVPTNRLYPTALQSSIEIKINLSDKNTPDIKDTVSIIVSPRSGGVVGSIYSLPTPTPTLGGVPTDFITPTDFPTPTVRGGGAGGSATPRPTVPEGSPTPTNKPLR